MGNSASAIPEPVWITACANIFISQNLTDGLVDQNGNPTNIFDNTTWGITHKACYDICGPDKIYQAFNFAVFSTSFTNWLLPWIALAAQLPYEAAGPGSNVLSGLMAIGSPALITYSLSLTILNRYWIKRSFAKLKRDSQAVSEWAPHISERIIAAEHLLQDAQQAPIRVSQEDGWLSSLIVLRDNQGFWKSVKKDLNNTRRRFSASMFAQMLMASIAYLFTIISAFQDGYGDNTVGLQIASGSIWVWMIPVIVGWIRTGTQWRAGAIYDALHDDSHGTFLALSQADAGNVVREERQEKIGEEERQEEVGEEKRQGNIIRGERQQGIMTLNPYHPEALTWLGCSVLGDEREEGPIYNYSRVFTWSQAALHIGGGFSAMLSRVHEGSQRRRQVNGDLWSDSNASDQRDPLAGTASQVAEYCDLPLDGTLNVYTPWSDIQPRVWHNILFATIAALFMQWGTTSPAILITYLTPLQGLGCRSAGYILYGSAATVAWFFLTSSCFLSHAAMLRHQDLQTNPPRGKEPRKIGQSILCFLAVCTRYMGKTLAVANAAWLIVSALLEYIGTYSTCWCNTDALSKGSQGWAAIFQEDLNLATAPSLRIWGSGLAFSLLACTASMSFFWLASADQMDGD